MRHILFKVSSKGAVEADTKKQSTDGLQLLMMQARKRGLPKWKAEGGTAKDRLYNNIIDSLGFKPNVGWTYTSAVCIILFIKKKKKKKKIDLTTLLIFVMKGKQTIFFFFLPKASLTSRVTDSCWKVEHVTDHRERVLIS